MLVQLTDRSANTPGQRFQVDYFDETVSGLALRVSKHGVKAWTFELHQGRRASKNLLRGDVQLRLWLGLERWRLRPKHEIEVGQDPSSAAGSDGSGGIADSYMGTTRRSFEQLRKSSDVA